jgi:hypothetical protein
MTKRRVLALLALTAIVLLRLEPQLLRLPFLNREFLARGLTAYPDRLAPQYPRFLQAVRERTQNGDSIVIVVPMLRWDDGYAYAYYRASYILAGREVLPLITSDDRAHQENYNAARYVASWRWNVPQAKLQVVWRGEGGTLLRRE